MSRWDMLKGRTEEEANELLKNLGYFVVEAQEQNFYQNAIKVEMEDGKITKIIGIGTWIPTKNER